MATKIKQVIDLVPWDSVFFSSWLSSKGIDRKEQTLYVRSGWLERIATGVYKLDGSTPTLYGAIASYDLQLKKHCHIGASSALDLRGYSHFVAIGKAKAYLFTSPKERLQNWLLNTEWDMEVRYFTTSLFKSETGLERYEYRGHQLLISGPERAFMEYLHLTPVEYSLIDAYYVMEMLTTLRPKIVQQLLEECSSVKVKRLFLYMSEKAGHQWFKALQSDRINIGSGKRALAEKGKYISKYQLTIPIELAEYE